MKKTKKPKKALILDWDGTCADSVDGAYKGVEEVFKQSDMVPPSFYDFWSNLGHPYENFFRERKVSMSSRRLWRIYNETANHCAADLFPDVLPALLALRQRGIVLGIITGNRPSVIRLQLRRHGLRGHFAHVVARGDKGEALREFSHAYSVRLNDMTYAGDFPCDVMEARSVGVRAVGVCRSGPHVDFRRSALFQIGALCVVRNFQPLPHIIPHLA